MMSLMLDTSYLWYQWFEGGTPNISGAIGLAYAAKYLENLGMDTYTGMNTS
jgi:selenocysteine lyase/cysteine desulfurase